MYVRVLQDELHFPEDRAMDQDTKSLIRGVSGFSYFFGNSLVDSLVWYSFSNEIPVSESVNQESRDTHTFR